MENSCNSILTPHNNTSLLISTNKPLNSKYEMVTISSELISSCPTIIAHFGQGILVNECSESKVEET